MQISFQHANPADGNESFLLRFEAGADETPCVLVDAGHGVDLDALLRPTDRLAALCLTHAHLDHYAELAAAHRDDAPILASPATAAVLDDVLDVAGAEHGVRATDAVADAVTPVDGWTDVGPGLDVHPVPAGHAPGAVGFLVRATDGDRSHHLLATGDFTLRRAGGFPGFDAEGFVDVDALFLTAATDDGFEAALTDALGTALEHASGGAPTLLATSGLVGVQCAYLLSALADEFDLRVPVRVVGQAAKLYEALGYDCSGVETIPYFEHTDECIEPGAVVVAGPEVPHRRSSGRLFGVLGEDPAACVVQLVSSGSAPLTEGQCTIHDHELANHPSREALVAVHDAVDPTQTVVTHRHGGAEGLFNDLSSVVWGSGDRREYTLFDGSRWRLPPWMSGETVSRDHGRRVEQLAGPELLASFPIPSIDRRDDVDLEAEGVDVDQIAAQLHRGPDAAASPDAPNAAAERPDDAPDSDPSRTMTSNGTHSTDSDDAAGDARQSPALVETIGADLGDEIDPDLRAALDDGGLTKADLTAAIAARERLAERDAGTDEEAADGAPPADGRGDGAATPDRQSADGVPADEPPADGATDAAPGTTDETATPPDSGSAGGETASDGTDDPSGERGGAPAAFDPGESTADEAVSLSLNPLAVALAGRLARERDDAGPGDGSVEAVAAEAVDRYVVALLAGEASGGEAERFALDLNASPAVERALDGVVAADGRFESTATLAADGLACALGGTDAAPAEVRIPGGHRRYLDAIAENEAYALDAPEAVVEAALAWFATGR